MSKYLVAIFLVTAGLSLSVPTAHAGWLSVTSFEMPAKYPGRLVPVQLPSQPGNPMHTGYRSAAVAPSLQVSPANPAAPTNPTTSIGQWGGIVDSMLAAVGLSALLSFFGLGGVAGTFIGSTLLLTLLAIAVILLLQLFQRKEHGQRMLHEPVLAGVPRVDVRSEPSALPKAPPQVAPPVHRDGAANWGVPADFDVPGFLRHAKACFIRLQASWDRGDVNDIRAFTTTEMFAELKLQLQERGAATSQTDVAILNADLLGIETTDLEYLASVKFSGMIRESVNPMAEPFLEVWHLVKPLSGQDGWTLAGIQQLQ